MVHRVVDGRLAARELLAVTVETSRGGLQHTCLNRMHAGQRSSPKLCSRPPDNWPWYLLIAGLDRSFATDVDQLHHTSHHELFNENRKLGDSE